MKKRITSLSIMLAVVLSLFPIANVGAASIQVGDYLVMGKYYDELILWRCVDIDEKGPLMLSDKILCLKMFDAGGDNASSSHGRIMFKDKYYRKTNGSNYWKDSNLRSWLNSTADAGNVVWLCGNPPTAENGYNDYNPYAHEKGFLASGNFTASERNAIKTVTQKSVLDGYEYSSSKNPNSLIKNENISEVLQNYATAYSEKATDKVFPLDEKQIYGVYENRGILGSSYYMAKPTQKAVDNSDYRTALLSPSGYFLYWLRSPSTSSSQGDMVRVVDWRSYVPANVAGSGSVGVRPAFYLNLPVVTFTSGSGSIGNPYTVIGASSSNSAAATTTKTITVYENKNDMSSAADHYIASSGAVVNAGGDDYITDTYGNVTIPANADVVISRANYITQTITANELANSNKVYLEKEGGGLPIIKAVTLNGQNLCNESVRVKGDGNIKADIDWNGNTAQAVYIEHGAVNIPVNNGETGMVELASLLNSKQKTYIIAKTADGLETKKILNISSVLTDIVIPKNINFGNAISNISASPIPIIGNELKLGVNIPNFPIEVTVKGNKAIATFGIDLAQWKYEKDFGNDQSGEWDNKYNINKDVADVLKDTISELGKDLISGKEGKELCDKMYKNILSHGKGKDVFKTKPAKIGFDANIAFLGYIEMTLDQYGIYVNDSGMIGRATAKLNATGHYAIAPMPVPLYWEAYVEGEIAAQLGIQREVRIENFKPQGSFEAKGTLGAGSGVGVSGIMSGGLGVEGSLSAKFQFITDTNFTLNAEAGAYVKVCFAIWEVKHFWAKREWQLYPDKQPASQGVSLMSVLTDTNNYSIQDRSYIANPSEFTANDRQKISLFGASPPNKIESTIKTNVYPNSAPQLVDLGNDKQLLVWVDDDTSRTSANRTSLYYSLFNGAWSQPQAVHNDGTADFSPQLKNINGNTYLVWQNAKTTFLDDVTLEQMAQNLEIYVAKYNDTNNTFVEVENVSNNDYVDMLPTVYGNGSEVNVVWVSNTENDIFGQNTNNQIMKYTFGGSVTAVASGLKAIDSVTADNDIIAYCVEMDGDIQTVEDKEIYIIKNGASSRLTDNEIIDSKPYFAGDGKLYWYSGGKINYIDNFNTNEVNTILSDETVIPTDRFVVAVNANNDAAVLFEQASGLNADLHSFIYDKTQDKWSENVALTELDSFINGFSGFIANDGQIKLAFNKQKVIAQIGEENPYGTADLCDLTISPSYNLSIEGDLFYDPDMLIAGNDLEINITVKNNGELTVNSLLLEILDEGDNVLQTTEISEAIVPGETKEYTAIYTISEGFIGISVKVNVLPVGCDDFDLSDNTKQVMLDCIDASLEDVYLSKTEEGKDIIYAHIVNRGTKDTGTFTLKLAEGTPNGTVVETKQVSSLAPLSATVESFEYSNPDIFKTKTLYILIEELADESFVGNNSDFVVLKGIKKLDMTVSNVEIISQDEACIELRLTIDTEKNTEESLTGHFLLAAYTESGLLLSISKEPVSIINITDTLIADITLPVKPDENILFKMFVWNSLGQIQPLSYFSGYLHKPV
ncbi:MAG: DUF6273 domain-containing protein [Firmicutes bacterium]|nr:DUF6273 domain-containing protein [Bacillota bacterium]